jgi:hypothetical protein
MPDARLMKKTREKGQIDIPINFNCYYHGVMIIVNGWWRHVWVFDVHAVTVNRAATVISAALVIPAKAAIE